MTPFRFTPEQCERLRRMAALDNTWDIPRGDRWIKLQIDGGELYELTHAESAQLDARQAGRGI